LRGAFCRSNLLIFKGLLPWPAALAPLAPRRAPGQALRNARNDITNQPETNITSPTVMAKTMPKDTEPVTKNFDRFCDHIISFSRFKPFEVCIGLKQ
jgi:hypothetical protein